MLKEQIESALKDALKAGDELKLSVLRMLSAAIHNREIEKRTRSGRAAEGVLDEEETSEVIRREMKKRGDAVEAYERASRREAAARERAEAEVLAQFLPPELSDGELEALIAEGQAALGVTSMHEFGKLMAWVMGRVRGRAGGERVSSLIRHRLAAA